jgi:excinuclease UvrABC nuclease subunit
MMKHAQNHEFERADIIKKQIESIETLNEKQIVRE